MAAAEVLQQVFSCLKCTSQLEQSEQLSSLIVVSSARASWPFALHISMPCGACWPTRRSSRRGLCQCSSCWWLQCTYSLKPWEQPDWLPSLMQGTCTRVSCVLTADAEQLALVQGIWSDMAAEGLHDMFKQLLDASGIKSGMITAAAKADERPSI